MHNIVWLEKSFEEAERLLTWNMTVKDSLSQEEYTVLYTIVSSFQGPH